MSEKSAGAKEIKMAPYGYAFDTDNVTLIPVQQEQKVLALIRILLSEGLTIARIAIELKRRELLTAFYLTIGEEDESGLALPEPLQRLNND